MMSTPGDKSETRLEIITSYKLVVRVKHVRNSGKKCPEFWADVNSKVERTRAENGNMAEWVGSWVMGWSFLVGILAFALLTS